MRRRSGAGRDEWTGEDPREREISATVTPATTMTIATTPSHHRSCRRSDPTRIQPVNLGLPLDLVTGSVTTNFVDATSRFTSSLDFG